MSTRPKGDRARKLQPGTFGSFGVELIEPRILLSVTPLITGLSPDTGASNSDGVTAATVLKLSGTADPNANVQIADGGTNLGTTKAGSTGTWSFTTQSLAQGSHSLTATAAGLTSSAKTAVVDTTAPAAPVLTAQPSFTRSATPAISGTAEAGSTVYVHDGTSAGMISPALGWVKADQNGNWSFQVTSPLSEGTHAFRATAVDLAGNQSANSSGLYVTIDRTAPAIASATEGLSGATRTTSQTIRVSATDSLSGVAAVQVFDSLNGAAPVELGAATLTNGSWVFTRTGLAEGSHSFTVVATDKVGNSTAPVSAGPAMVVDTVAPGAPVLSAQPSLTRNATPTISGTAEAGSTIYVHDGTASGIIAPALGTVKADQNGNWSFQVTSPLAEGTHAFRAISVDAAGNQSANSAGLYVTIDRSAPVVTSTTETVSGPTRLTSQTIRVVASDSPSDVGGVQVYDSLNGAAAVDLGAATLTNGSWVFTRTGLSDGSHAFTIVATDKLGNSTAPVSAGAAMVVDTTAPVVASAVESASGLTNATAQTVTVAAIDATSTVAGVDIYDSLNGGPAAKIGAAAPANGTWVFSTAGLADGTHNFTVVATDGLGNSSAPASAGAALVVDTTPPAAPVLAALSPLTKTNTPTLSGTAEAGSTVSIFDGTSSGSTGPAVGTATADQTGNWTFQVGGALLDGTHVFRASATDAAGNGGAPSAPVSTTIDTVAPEAPVLNALGAIISNNRPALSGTAEAGSLVTVSDGRTVLGTSVAAGNGTWSFTPPASVADGPHSFSATATDGAGNVSAPPPGLTIRVSADLWNGDLQPYPQFSVTIDGQQVGSVFTAKAVHDEGGWETLTISPGALASMPRSIVVTFLNDGYGGSHATDRNLYVDYVAVNGVRYEAESAVNRAAPAGYNLPGAAAMLWNDTLAFSPSPLVVDTTAPAAPTITTLPAFVATAKPLFTGTAEGATTVTVYDGATVLGSTVATASGAWSFTPGTALAQGPHTFSAVARDAAGSLGSASPTQTVQVDTIAPAAPAIDPLPVWSKSPTRDLGGRAEAGSAVTVFDGTTSLGTALANDAGAWTLSVTLADGPHVLSAAARDPAGNTGLASPAQALNVDTVAPAAPTLSPLPTVTRNPTLTVSGTAEAGSTVTVYDGATALGQAVVDPAGAWSFIPMAGLPAGDHRISAAATDAAGNTGASSAPALVTVDTSGGVATGPAAPAVNALQSLTSSGRITITGTAQAGTTITVFDGTTAFGTAVADGAGVWSFASSTPLTDGVHSIAAVATDAQGNVSAASPAQTVTVDSLLVTWTNAAGGLWSDAANWSTGALPGANAHVRLDLATGAEVVFNLPGSTTIGQLAVNSGTLTLAGGNISLGGGLTNAANLVVQRGSLAVGGSLVNAGTLSVQADATLNVSGALTLAATSRLTFEIADFDYFGSIRAGSDVNLAGAVSFSRRNAYMPSLGTNYAVIAAAVLPGGNFSDVQNTNVGNGTKLQLSTATSGVSAVVTAATTKAYYVDSTAAAGGDGSIDRPYNSFGQLPSRTGDLDATIFLKRGSLFRETLQFDNATNFIVDAYGEGAAPIISGADRVVATWVQEGPNWYLSNVSLTQAVFQDATRYQAVTSKDLLVAGTSWWDAATSRLYVSTLAAADPNGQSFEITARDTGLDARDSYGFTVRNIQVQRTGDVGLHIQAGQNAQALTPHDILIEGVSAIYNGSWDLFSRIGDGFCLNGLSADAPAQNIVFRSNYSAYNVNCVIEANNASGLVLEDNVGEHCGNGIEFYLSVQNATVTRNVISNIDTYWLGHGNGLWLTSTSVAAGAGGHRNIVVSNNVFENTRNEGLDIGDGTGLKIDGNLIYNASMGQPAGSGTSVTIAKKGDGAVSYQFTNNIVYLTRSMFAFKIGADTTGTLDFNDYYGGGGAHAVYSYGGSFYTSWATGFADFKAATGQDAHSFSVNPGFVGTGDDPLQLRSTSPLATAGSGTARYDLQRHVYGPVRPIGPYSTVQVA